MWDRTDGLREVVRDLVAEHHAETAEEERTHSCDAGCSHSGTRGRALLDEVADLVLPPQEAMKPPSARHQKVTGSPAPWSAPAGELLDEVHRGAVDLLGHARAVLGMPVATVRVGDRWVALDRFEVEVAGRWALRQLPDHLGQLLARPATRTHHLTATMDRYGHMRPGRIEGEVFAWRARCRRLLGYEVRPARLRQVPNPHHPENSRSWWEGLAHGAGCPASASGCWHDSCAQVLTDRAASRARWVQATCPYCGRASLLQDPATGDVLCDRPGCTTDAGTEPRWTVAELERLGLLVTQTVREGVPA